VEAVEQLLEMANEAETVTLQETIRLDGGECMRALVEGFGGGGEAGREALCEMMKKKRASGLTLLQECVAGRAVECVRGLLGGGGGGQKGPEEEEAHDDEEGGEMRREEEAGCGGAPTRRRRGDGAEETVDVGVNEKTHRRTGPF
jgi:hypothetical protein